MNYLHCGVEGLHFPLMCLIDYRGFRLVAISILPIDSDTIVYGSANVGLDVHADHQEINLKMERIGNKMNSKPHLVGRAVQKIIYGPVDIEVHCGKDGRIYLVDFARYCPPEPPQPGHRGSNLYRLLRPELVKKYPKPLSSDAFSNLGNHDSATHNNEVKEAFLFLFNQVVHECASEVCEVSKAYGDHEVASEVVACIHRHGVNLRHIGVIRNSPKLSGKRARY